MLIFLAISHFLWFCSKTSTFTTILLGVSLFLLSLNTFLLGIAGILLSANQILFVTSTFLLKSQTFLSTPSYFLLVYRCQFLVMLEY